jgi:hypothetical protein
MHRLITLYRKWHTWLFDVEKTRVVWVGIQTVHGMIYAALRVREE